MDEISSTLYKLTLTYFDNHEPIDGLLENAIYLLQKSEYKPDDVLQITTDEEAFRYEIFYFLICSYLLPIYQTCYQFEKMYDKEFTKYLNYANVAGLCPNLTKAFTFVAGHCTTKGHNFHF